MAYRCWLFLLATGLWIIPGLASAQIHFTAVLDGIHHLPAVSTPASGTGSFELTEDFTQLKYAISYQRMSAGGVSAALFAGTPGELGSPVLSVVASGPTDSTFKGVWKSTDAIPLTRALVDSLLEGGMYMEMSDTRYPAGEIRGQVDLATALHFEVHYSSAELDPPVSGTGEGTGVFVLDRTRTRLDYRVTYRGLSGPLSTGGYLRTGWPGMDGPAVLVIAPPGTPSSATVRGSWTSNDTAPLTPSLVDSLIAGSGYSDFRTVTHTGGEIRGRLVLRGGFGFVAALDSSQVNPPPDSHGSGTGSFVLNESRNQVSYHLTYIGLAGPPESGGVVHLGTDSSISGVKTLAPAGDTSEATVSGTWSVSDAGEAFSPALAESLMTDKLAVGIRTASSPGGEIGGRVKLTTGLGFTSQLSASQDVPPTVQSRGTGTASVVLSPDLDSISYSVTFLNLSANIAPSGGHFHTGAVGSNGGLVKTIVPPNAWGSLTVTGVWRTTDEDGQPLTAALVDSLVAGHMYINLHTGAYIGGEIRGQVSYDGEVVTSVPVSPSQLPVRFGLEQNFPNPFNPSTEIRFSLPQEGRVVLKIYDILGRQVAQLYDEVLSAGSHEVRWVASQLSSGVYVITLTEGSFFAARKMLLLK